MADAEYSVIFKTRAELEGAVQLQQSLERQRGQLIALGKDTSGVDGKLNTVTDSLKKFGESGEENAKKIKEAMGELGGEGEGNPLEGIHGRLRQIHAALGLLGVRGGEVGHLLHLAFSPQLVLFGAVAAAIGKIVEEQKELRKEQDEMVAEAAQGFGAMKEAADKARESVHTIATEYTNWINDLVRQGPKAKEQLESQLQTLQAMQGAMEALAKLQGRPAEDVKKATAAAELDLTRQAKENAQKELAHSKTESDRLEKKLKEPGELARIGEGGLPKQIADAEARQKKTEESLNKVLDKLDTAQAALAAAAPEAKGAPLIRVQEATEEANRLREERKSEIEFIAAARKHLEELKTSRDAEAKALKDNQEAAKQSAAAIDTLTKKITELEIKARFEKAAETISTSPVAGIVVPGAQAELLKSKGQKLSTEQQAQDQALIDFLKSLGAYNPTILQLLRQHANDVEWLTNEIRALQTRAANPSTKTQPASG
jgi:hypothetical protein